MGSNTSKRRIMNQRSSSSKRKVNEVSLGIISGFAGHRVRVPPDPIPNSEVKPCSVSSCSVVLGYVNLGKLAAHFDTLIVRVIFT